MEFFIKTKPEFKEHFQTGMQLTLSMGERLVEVTITKIEDINIFLKATGEDAKYLQSLFEEKTSTFSMNIH